MNTDITEITVNGVTWKVLRVHGVENNALEVSVYQQGSDDVYRGYYYPEENTMGLFNYPLSLSLFAH